MFVRLLVLLISHVLCCFSDLLCCRSLVQFVVQRGGIEQRWNLGPCQCDRAHLVRSNAVCSSPRGAIERMPRQPHILRCLSRHRFIACAVGILRQLRAIDLTSRNRTSCIQLNAHRPEIERTTCDRTHTGLRSSASLTW